MIKTFFRSALVIILLILITAVSRNVYTQATKFQEIHQAESKVSELEQENESLEAELKEKESSFFIEKQARDKLGYQKEGDVLYVVSGKKEPTEAEKQKAKENWQRWLELLF